MSDHPADFRIEIIKDRPQGIGASPIDVTEYVDFDNFGSVNRALERDLLSFKTGDLTCDFLNDDGLFDDLFSALGPTDIWTLVVFRRGTVQFRGCVIGLGSIIFNRKTRIVEVTAYGLTKLLDLASAAVVARGPIAVMPNGAAFDGSGTGTLLVDSTGGFLLPFPEGIELADGQNSQQLNLMSRQYPDTLHIQPGPFFDFAPGATVAHIVFKMTVTTATGGTTSATLNTTAGLQTGDVLHFTDQINKEDLTIKQVTSATVVAFETALSNTYAAGSPVTLNSPFYRCKSIDFLVRALFAASAIPIAEVTLQNSLFNRLAPTPVNVQGLGLTADARRGCYQLFGNWGIAIAGVDSYSQQDPAGAWTVQGLTDKGIYDWSPYYMQGFWRGGPIVGTDEPFAIYEPATGASQEGGAGGKFMTWWGGVDYISATKRIWGFNIGTVPAPNLLERTTVDGVTYTGVTTLALPADNDINPQDAGCEYDPVRNFTYVSWRLRTGTNRHFRYRDWGGAAWVDCKQADDVATTGYYGARYVADKDYVLALRATGTSTGPNFEICAFRGSTRLWKRSFPPCLIAQDVAGHPAFYPTRTARFVNGSIYMVLVSNGAVQLLRSDDDFKTYTMRKLVDSTLKTVIMACRVNDTYRIACYKGANPTGYFIAAPFYAGVVDYADFDGLSAAEALKKLSILTNSLFWVDDDLQGHFVARDLYDPDTVVDVSDRVLEQSDTLIWKDTAQYVKVSGNNIEVTAGDDTFAAQGIELDSSLVPNEAFAQALADVYYAVYSPAKEFSEANLMDPDGRIYQPLDRVIIDGQVRAIQESDHSLLDDEVATTFLRNR